MFGLSKDDEKKLKDGLDQLKTLNDDLSAKYSLRADLQDLNDNRYTVRHVLLDELKKISAHQQELISKTTELAQVKEQLNESLAAIEKIQEFIAEDEDGDSDYSDLLKLIDEKNLEELDNKSDEIHQFYTQLFDNNDGDKSKAEQINDQITKIANKYKSLFDELDDNEETKIEEYERKINELIKYYDGLFLSDDPEVQSKEEQINSQLLKIQKFHDKVYGDKEKNIPSLTDDLTERLENLKSIEAKAKSVIGLSSEAGLAGGFVVKGKEAKNGQIISIVVFVAVVLIIFGFNLYFFDKSDFLNMEWNTFIFKLLINAPLIWIATIANINLNKFSRLEQEYSHKEALAKSYERYKAEIQELESLGAVGSNELKLKLLEINLEAFKVNPAEKSDKAKADFSIWELLTNKSKASSNE